MEQGELRHGSGRHQQSYPHYGPADRSREHRHVNDRRQQSYSHYGPSDSNDTGRGHEHRHDSGRRQPSYSHYGPAISNGTSHSDREHRQGNGRRQPPYSHYEPRRKQSYSHYGPGVSDGTNRSREDHRYGNGRRQPSYSHCGRSDKARGDDASSDDKGLEDAGVKNRASGTPSTASDASKDAPCKGAMEQLAVADVRQCFEETPDKVVLADAAPVPESNDFASFDAEALSDPASVPEPMETSSVKETAIEDTDANSTPESIGDGAAHDKNWRAASSACATSRSNTASRATKLNVQQQKETTPSVNITPKDAETTPPVNNEPTDAQTPHPTGAQTTPTVNIVQTTQSTQSTGAQTRRLPTNSAARDGLLRGILKTSEKTALQKIKAEVGMKNPLAHERDVAARATSLQREARKTSAEQAQSAPHAIRQQGRALQTLRVDRNVLVPTKKPKRLKSDVSVPAETKLVIPRSLSSMLEKEPASASTARALATCQRVLATAPPVPSNDGIQHNGLVGRWQAPVSLSTSSHALVASSSKKRQVSWTENDRRAALAQQIAHDALTKPAIVPGHGASSTSAALASLDMEDAHCSTSAGRASKPASKAAQYERGQQIVDKHLAKLRVRKSSSSSSHSKETRAEIVVRLAAERAEMAPFDCPFINEMYDVFGASGLVQKALNGFMYDDPSNFNALQLAPRELMAEFKAFREGRVPAGQLEAANVTYRTKVTAELGDGASLGQGHKSHKGTGGMAILHFPTNNDKSLQSDYDKAHGNLTIYESACPRMVAGVLPRAMHTAARRELYGDEAEKSDIVCNSLAMFDASPLAYDVGDADAVARLCDEKGLDEGQFFALTFLSISAHAQLTSEANGNKPVNLATFSVNADEKLYDCAPPRTTSVINFLGNLDHPQKFWSNLTCLMSPAEMDRQNQILSRLMFPLPEFDDIPDDHPSFVCKWWGKKFAEELKRLRNEALARGRATNSEAWRASRELEDLSDAQEQTLRGFFLRAHEHGQEHDIHSLLEAASAMMRELMVSGNTDGFDTIEAAASARGHELAEAQIASYGEKHGMTRDAAATARARELNEGQIASYAKKYGMTRDAGASEMMREVASAHTDETSVKKRVANILASFRGSKLRGQSNCFIKIICRKCGASKYLPNKTKQAKTLKAHKGLGSGGGPTPCYSGCNETHCQWDVEENSNNGRAVRYSTETVKAEWIKENPFLGNIDWDFGTSS